MKGKIFNAQEVQDIIADKKTQFREVVKVQPDNARQKFSTIAFSTMRGERGKHRFVEVENLNIITHTKSFKCPYQIGQRIFVKERFFEEIHPDSLRKNGTPASPWKSPVHMKQEHSRLTLEITDIKVERLKDISEEDAIKEGVNKLFTEEEMKHVSRIHQIEKNDTYKNYLWHGHIGRTITKKQSDEWECQCSAYEKAQDSFFSLWNATHKKPEEKFEVNPFVWVVDFKINN